MRFLAANLNAMLVELDDLEQTLALLASLRADPIAGIEEMVPAARTLLLVFRPAACSMAALARAVARRDLRPAPRSASPLIEIPVHYDGEDLAEVAGMLNITPQELVRRHTAAEYSAAFTGFAPGFAYLSGGDPSLDVPRRATPRSRIPAGSVGLAGTFSGVYPQASPGGWQIIGATPAVMWDLDRDMPALLQPGFRVRFVDIATLPEAARQALEHSRPAPVSRSQNTVAATGPALEVLATGLQSLFQDLGRPGQAGQGVAPSGAMDRAALKAANRLVGNASDSACVETVEGGLRLRCHGQAVVAVTGADAAVAVTRSTGASHTAQRHAPIALDDGDILSIGAPSAGIRCYVAVRGGFDIAPVLGSCSTDMLARLGPPAISGGDLLPVRPLTHAAVVGAQELSPTDLPSIRDEVVLDIVLGPRTDWFTPESVERLCRQPWQVTPQSGRVGLRLSGAEPLQRRVAGELPSEGTVLGALQVPPSGQPVLFMADHPLTGGYPVIGAVAPHHLDLAGQLPVHAWIRFRPIRDFAPLHSQDFP
jgi:KipI family sensor histidine kinase inhibitor